jgi:hypothetical protein
MEGRDGRRERNPAGNEQIYIPFRENFGNALN